MDLIISDMRMPGMDGAAFLAEARKRQPDAVRLLLTGYADMESTIAAINAGRSPATSRSPGTTRTCCSPSARPSNARPAARKTRLEALTKAQNEELRSLNASLEQKVEARTAELRRPREAQAELPDLDPGVLQPHRAARGRVRPRGGSPTWPARSPSGWA
jgi:response regulator RpfG family c-di-GMP phosphodiesterase